MMEIEEFGAALIETLDLDPVYVMLYRAELPRPLLKRWLVAYWCFYHSGVASAIAETDDGWEPFLSTHPRGTERRHFRGALYLTSIERLRARYQSPEDLFDYLAAGTDLRDVITRVKEHYGFGDWIGFKVADLLDRVAGVPLDFDQAAVFMFKDPRKAVDMLWERRVAPIAKTHLTEAERIDRVVSSLIQHFAGYKAPPGFDRPIGVAEVETILCKYRAHTNGHYPVGKDTREIRESLTGYGALAERLAEYFDDPKPERPEWQRQEHRSALSAGP